MKKVIKNDSKHIIGIDLDDTLLDFNNSLHAYHNKKYGTNITRENITSYELDKVWGYSPEEVDKKLFEFYFTKEHEETAPIFGSLDAVNKLKNRHDLHLITVRGDQIAEPTMLWIQTHFPSHFTSINLTNKIFGIPGKTYSKVDVCRRLGVDLMIEDSLSQAIEISKVVEKVYLLDCPWNQGETPTNMTRVNSWDEIITHLNSN